MKTENLKDSGDISNKYLQEKDPILRLWGWDVQQISNSLLYHALGISPLQTKFGKIDYLGSEIIQFTTHVMNSFESAKILFPKESIRHIELFIAILELIDHKYIYESTNCLRALKNWYSGIGYLTEKQDYSLGLRTGSVEC